MLPSTWNSFEIFIASTLDLFLEITFSHNFPSKEILSTKKRNYIDKFNTVVLNCSLEEIVAAPNSTGLPSVPSGIAV